ncbi:MAG: hypothetical protein HY322_13365 [Betaproteobacteria bacterium]|nr:hypothetical protein [Betaproteobacteria bacterium]
MLQPQRILLASHGTPGARAAESIALALAMPGATLFHLTVVPDFWRGMPGLRSRMQVEGLVRGLAAPLLVAPYPE